MDRLKERETAQGWTKDSRRDSGNGLVRPYFPVFGAVSVCMAPHVSAHQPLVASQPGPLNCGTRNEEGGRAKAERHGAEKRTSSSCERRGHRELPLALVQCQEKAWYQHVRGARLYDYAHLRDDATAPARTAESHTKADEELKNSEAKLRLQCNGSVPKKNSCVAMSGGAGGNVTPHFA